MMMLQQHKNHFLKLEASGWTKKHQLYILTLSQTFIPFIDFCFKHYFVSIITSDKV